MIKAVWFIFKFSLLTIVILLVGSHVTWKGKTISDQVKSQVASAKKSTWGKEISAWTGSMIQDAEKTIRTHTGTDKNSKRSHKTNIAQSEREKLKKLIEDLNNN